MKGDDLALLGVEHPVALFESRNHALHRMAEIGHRYRVRASARRKQSGFIDEVGQVSSGEARREGGDGFRIEARGKLHLPYMHLQDIDASFLVGTIDQHLAIEPS